MSIPHIGAGADTCFCGCGRSMAFVRARALNAQAMRIGTATCDLAGDDACLGEAARPRAPARAVLHDDAPGAEAIRTVLATRPGHGATSTAGDGVAPEPPACDPAAGTG